MKIIDVVYGEEEINEEILIDLINSDEVQRLKGISQFGLPDKYYHKKGFSRYEHSVGVFILLHRLGASLEEQIAGLLHDVSHTAFSHVVDWVVGDPTKEDYQDGILAEFIEKSNLPNILKKHGFNYKQIINHEKFSLLETPAPNLCADRVDYCLRETKLSGEVPFILEHLKNFKGKIVFDSTEAAKLFAESYMKCQKEHWAGNQARTRYYILSNVLKKALDGNLISLEDLKKTDNEVINLLLESNDFEIVDGLNLLDRGFETEPSENGIILKKKFRYVDPAILLNNEMKKLSEISEEYFGILEREKQDSDKFEKINIIPL